MLLGKLRQEGDGGGVVRHEEGTTEKKMERKDMQDSPGVSLQRKQWYVYPGKCILVARSKREVTL